MDRPALEGNRRCVNAWPCQNGILHIPTRQTITHTPRYWSPNVLDFSYDPSALALLGLSGSSKKSGPRDAEAQQCLLEVIGLCFTDITKYQKGIYVRWSSSWRSRHNRSIVERTNRRGELCRQFVESIQGAVWNGKLDWRK